MSFNQERRRVLEGFLVLLGAGLSAQSIQCQAKPKGNVPRKSSRVACARRPGVIDPATGAIVGSALRDLLGKSLGAAVGAEDPAGALRRLFHRGDVVGIKVNTLAGRGLSSRPELVFMLCEWLREAGVRPNNIVIWDRSDRELEAAGFKLNRSDTGVRCFGTNDDYDWTPREWGPGGSCFARVLVSELTALINVGVLKDHDLAGVSAGLKNLYGVIHNPNKYHDNGCNPYVAHLAAHPLLKSKMRLTVIDGLVAQCHGGPARSPRWAWPWGGVLVSTDPVSVDAVALRLIDERRREVGLKTLAADGREPKWIAEAARLKLGEARLDEIDVVNV